MVVRIFVSHVGCGCRFGVYSSWNDFASKSLSLHHSFYIQSNELSSTTIPMGQICLGYSCSKKFIHVTKTMDLFAHSKIEIWRFPPSPNLLWSFHIYSSSKLNRKKNSHLPFWIFNRVVSVSVSFTPSSRAPVKLQAFPKKRWKLDPPQGTGRMT